MSTVGNFRACLIGTLKTVETFLELQTAGPLQSSSRRSKNSLDPSSMGKMFVRDSSNASFSLEFAPTQKVYGFTGLACISHKGVGRGLPDVA